MGRSKRGNRQSRRSKYNQSLNQQMHERMQKMVRMGENKHEAKQKTPNGNTEGIFSKTTYDNYKQVSIQFVAWLKEKHNDMKHIDDLSRNIVIKYLQERQQEGLSPNTLSRDLGAVNKLFGFGITKQEANLRQRSYKTITRSRSNKTYNHQYNPKNYAKQLAVAKAFGSRRESFVTGDYCLKEGSIYICKGNIYAAVVEKGGKFRNIEIRADMQEQIEASFNLREQPYMFNEQDFKEAYHAGKLGKKLFERYTRKIDNHALRREYAQKKYQELEAKLTDPKNNYYQQYDKRVLSEVSKQLGHRRLRVIVEHYLC